MSYNSRLSPNREGTHKHLGIGNISPRPSNRRVSWRLHLPGPLSIKISHYTNINNNTNININRKLFGGGGVVSPVYGNAWQETSVCSSLHLSGKSAPTQIQDKSRLACYGNAWQETSVCSSLHLSLRQERPYTNSR